MNNKKIRDLLYLNSIKHYEVANKLGISPYTFSVWLRYELTDEKEEMVLKAIAEISKEA